MTGHGSSAERSPAGLARDMELLRTLSDAERETGEGLGVMRLAEITGRDKSQVSRAMTALEGVGFVERDSVTLRYRLGYGLFVLATRGIDRGLIAAANPYLQKLARDLHETTHLCVLAGSGVLTIESIAPPDHMFRASGWIGQTTPAHRCSVGWVLLGEASREFVMNKFATTRFRSDAPGQVVHNVRTFWEQIERARIQGYAVDVEELEADLIGAAAPIRNSAGRIIGAICTSLPKERGIDRLDDLGVAVRDAADDVAASLQLGTDPM